MRTLIKRLIPPFIFDIFKQKNKYGYFGDYKTWQQAVSDSIGYKDKVILEKVKDSLLKVKNNQAVYERDSLIFKRKEYSWPVLAGLLLAASRNNNFLHILDFGGSLGSSYFQNMNILKHINLKWYIVEQPDFVKCGKEFFEDERLKFAFSIEDVLGDNISVFLASSSLQYIEEPYKILEKVVHAKIPYVIVDRTIFLTDSERITVQKIRPEIYPASYPARFLNEKRFLDLFKENYSLISDFSSYGTSQIDLGDKLGTLKGYLFELK